MTKAIFHYNPNSRYDDDPAARYHFPAQYLDRVMAAIGDMIIYYGPLPGKSGRYYTGLATVIGVRPDPATAKHFFADVRDYIGFDRPIEYRENGGFERRLVLPGGRTSGGLAINAVRPISDEEFASIIDVALAAADDWPDRDSPSLAESGFSEEAQIFISRPLIQEISNRAFRDRKFKQHVRRAYDRTCAFTGLRLINGLGRPEVNAAHIIPVEENGSDSVRNGLALSATVHWMFDRGFLSLSDDHNILVSRHLNSDVSHLLLKDRQAKVPAESWLQPHPECLQWHRQNRFKG